MRLVHFAGFAVLAAFVMGCDPTGIDPNLPDLLIHEGDVDDRRVVGIRLADGERIFSFEGRLAAWSPDGMLISFVDGSGYDSIARIGYPGPLVLATPDGERVRVLSEVGGRHSWSPDGSKIAVGYEEHGPTHFHASIHVIDTRDGGRVLAGPPNTIVHWLGSGPSWSPDSRRFAACEMTCIVNADGTGIAYPNGRGLGAAWSPDGDRIAIWASLSDESWQGPPTVRREIFVIPPGGGERTQLTDTFEENARLLASTFPVWSPDGTKIAYVREVVPAGATPPLGRSHLYVMNADGSDPRRVGLGEDVSRPPAWSPDGTRIAYTSGLYTSDLQVRVVNLDGTGDRFVAHGSAPAWRPTGMAR